MISGIDIIFLTILVVFIFSRLFSVLGKDEDGITVNMSDEENNAEDKKEQKRKIVKVVAEDGSCLVCTPRENAETENKAESEFNKEAFLKGACQVFEMTLEAFSKGNLVEVKDLLSKKVYKAFSEALAVRKEKNMSSEVDFICFDKKEVKDVKFLENKVKVIVEFISEQINILRDSEGNVVEGDENFVQKITDVWTFERLMNAKNANWLLVSTKKTV